MIIKLKKFDYKAIATGGAWTPEFPAKYLSKVARIRKGYRLDASCKFVYPYGYGDTVAPTCLAKWVN